MTRRRDCPQCHQDVAIPDEWTDEEIEMNLLNECRRTAVEGSNTSVKVTISDI